jgi:hypothetical protein
MQKVVVFYRSAVACQLCRREVRRGIPSSGPKMFAKWTNRAYHLPLTLGPIGTKRNCFLMRRQYCVNQTFI